MLTAFGANIFWELHKALHGSTVHDRGGRGNQQPKALSGRVGGRGRGRGLVKGALQPRLSFQSRKAQETAGGGGGIIIEAQ